MRLRNKRALQDKTPRNSPQPTKLRSPSSKHTPVAKHLLSPEFAKPSLSTTAEDAQEALETPRAIALRETELHERDVSISPSAAASARKRGPVHSTPLMNPRRRAARPTTPTPVQDDPVLVAPLTPKHDRASSPLPPSSPPSDFEFTRKRVPTSTAITRPAEDPGEPDPSPEVQAAAAAQKAVSSDDPFGFLVVERKLKAQRAARKHPHRVIAPAPAFKTLARDSSEERVAPLRSDDDDLYMELNPELEEEANKENIPVPVLPTPSEESLQKAELGEDAEEGVGEVKDEDEEEDEDEDKENKFEYVLSSDIRPHRDSDEDEEAVAELDAEEVQEQLHARRARSEDSYDPLRTPHAAHVSKDIYPIRSPFSSRSTPCDRDLAIDSAPSSPSPSKPLQIATPLPPSIHPIRRLGDALKASQEKSAGKRKADGDATSPDTSAKKSRLAQQSAHDEVAPAPSSALDDDSPLKRPLRRSARHSGHAVATSAPGPSQAAATRLTRAAKGKAPAVDADSDDDESLDESDEEEQTAKQKGGRKAIKAESKKARASSAPTVKRRGRKPSATTAPKKPRMSAKAKGKQRAQDVKDEDEEALEARRARIAYFKKLDKDYSLAKENVYVV